MFTRDWLWLIVPVLSWSASSAVAQTRDPGLPPTPTPVPVAPASYGSAAPAPFPAPYAGAPGAPMPPVPPGPYMGPPPTSAASPPLSAPPPGGAMYVPGEPRPYQPYSILPTIFFETDLYFLKPSVTGSLNGNQKQSDGSTYTFHTPSASLDVTVSPRFDFGWRLPDYHGEFIFSYRFISSAGSAHSADAFGALEARSHLDMNVFDFDYGTARYSPWARFSVQARLGVRLETVYFNNEAVDGQGFYEYARSNFVGAGPHAAVLLDYELAAVPGMSVFARVDGALAFGQDRQRFSETYADGTYFPFSQSRTNTVSNFTVQAGLSYSPSLMHRVRLFGGFQYERFWDVGKAGASTGDVQDIGGFIGGMLSF